MDPMRVEILGAIEIKISRSETSGPRQILSLTPQARLSKLKLHNSFDLRAIPMNIETRVALEGVCDFEGHLLSATDLLKRQILPKTISALTMTNFIENASILDGAFPNLRKITFKIGP